MYSPAKSAERPAVIRLRDVSKSYATATGNFLALNGVHMDVYAGELVVIIGRSGAGKSTLVNMITGVDQVTNGEVWVNGTPVHALNEDEMALWRGRNVGVVFQSFELLSALTLTENVVLPMDFCGLYRPRESQARARALLTQVGLEEHMGKSPTRISGGQQQRVAIARALANDPSILVADEPTGNLDSSTAEEIFRLFEGLTALGKTVVLVTHDSSVALRASRTLRLSDGILAEEPGA